MSSVRYMVDDVKEALDFYREYLGFTVEWDMGPNFASVRLDDLSLWLAGPGSSAGRPMPDGAKPEAGGWNRFVIEVDDIEARVQRLKDAGASFRNEIVRGPGGAQILIQDPSGNVVELFQRAS
ncbi:MAG: VOC family protein [Chloroflexi bacterium]|nr:MAG: VOC family protein [Chloroflexota bacterium]